MRVFRKIFKTFDACTAAFIAINDGYGELLSRPLSMNWSGEIKVPDCGSSEERNLERLQYENSVRPGEKQDKNIFTQILRKNFRPSTYPPKIG